MIKKYNSSYVLLIIYLIIGFILGDFFVAFGHWFEDNYLYYDYKLNIPFLNEKVNDISKGNDLHHYVPRLLTQKSYFSAFMSTAIFIPFIILIYLCIPGSSNINNIMIIIGFCFMIAISEITHRWQHYRNCEKNNIIRFLQKTIIVSSEEHAVHHSTKYVEGNYGVISKHLNKLYDKIEIWNFLEKIIPNRCKKTNKFPNKPILNDCPYKMSESEKSKYISELKYIRNNNLIPKCY